MTSALSKISSGGFFFSPQSSGKERKVKNEGGGESNGNIEFKRARIGGEPLPFVCIMTSILEATGMDFV